MFIITFITVHITHQRHLRQIISQRNVFIALFHPHVTEVLHTVHQFLHILLPRQILRCGVLIDFSNNATLLHNHRTDLIGRHFVYILNERFNHLTEWPNLRQCSFIHPQSILFWIVDNTPKTHFMQGRCSQNLCHRSLSNTTCRVIDHTFECLFIIRIHCQTKIRNHIFDFLALVERKSSIYAVRQSLFPHRVLKHTTLGISSIKDSKIIVFVPLSTLDIADGIHHHLCLFKIWMCVQHMQLFPSIILWKNILLNLVRILLNQAVRCLYNILSRTVIPFQFKQLRIIIYLLECQYVINICTTKTINTLSIVSNHTNMLMMTGQLPHNSMLCIVRVLVLIHQHISESLLPFFQHLRVPLK